MARSKAAVEMNPAAYENLQEVRNQTGRPSLVPSPSTDNERKEIEENISMVNAIQRCQAVIEFGLDGSIIHANDNFLGAIGYAAHELAGQHHRMFVTADFARSTEYQAFWEKLRAGEVFSGEFMRLGKGGREVWIQASYNPIFDNHG
jgi:methyl-accepting chemotaxis protein